jgi:hypothetical protein
MKAHLFITFSEVTSHHFSSILPLNIELLNPDTSPKKGSHKDKEQDRGIVGGYLSGCLL